MQYVGPLIARCAVCFAYCASRLLAVVAAFRLAGDSAMQSLDLSQSPLEGLGVGNDRAIREGGERLDAQVYAHHRPGVDRNRLFLLHLDTHVPVSGLFRDRRTEYLDARCATRGQVAALFQSQPT